MIGNATARFRTSMLLLAGLAITACADNDIFAPTAGMRTQANSTPNAGFFLTKRGPAGTTATFSITATGGTLVLGSTVTLDACPEDGSVVCTGTLVWTATSDELANVTVTEVATTGSTVFDQIAASRTMDGVTEYFGVFAPDAPTITLAMNATANANVRFKNVESNDPPPARLRVEKTAVNGTVKIGSPLAYTIKVFSEGPGTATNVTLNDPLPAGAGITWSTSNVNCTITGSAPQTLNCAFGDMAAGAIATVTVTGTTGYQTQCGNYNNTVFVNADNHPTVQSSATIAVTGCKTKELEGCTPGYWKQKHHFGSWIGYIPTSRYNAVFGVNLFSNSTTLLDALSTGGGDKARFGRHSTAALLSAANNHVNYGMTAAEVIAAVKQAVSKGSAAMDKLADELERRNESGCPLGRSDNDDHKPRDKWKDKWDRDHKDKDKVKDKDKGKDKDKEKGKKDQDKDKKNDKDKEKDKKNDKDKSKGGGNKESSKQGHR